MDPFCYFSSGLPLILERIFVGARKLDGEHIIGAIGAGSSGSFGALHILLEVGSFKAVAYCCAQLGLSMIDGLFCNYCSPFRVSNGRLSCNLKEKKKMELHLTD